MGAGSVFSLPSSAITVLTYFIFFAVMVAISSALVELSAVMDCVLESYNMAPLQCVNAYPIVNRLFVGVFP